MSISDNLQAVVDRIESARVQSGRNDEIQLVAVSKTFPAVSIEPVLAAGQRVFGENRVQEAAEKWPALKRDYPDVMLHLIGPLQTNKTAIAVNLFDCIQTLDRPKLAKILAREMKRLQKKVEIFVQVNIGNEPQKSGVAVSELPEFLKLCRKTFELEISGLMCIPPVGDDPEEYFDRLAQLARENDVKYLSMGMSGDFEQAIAAGASHVRVGTAIFGHR